MNDFKVPQTFSQDLLLIQELVDIPLLPDKPLPLSHIPDNDDIRSSGSESEDEVASEEEIATDLSKRNATDDEITQHPEPVSSETSSDSSCSSESDDSEGEEEKELPGRQLPQDIEDDEDPVPASTSGGYFTTKNETTVVDIRIPGVKNVSPEERLEKVGEIMNIVDRVAIVRGLRSDYLDRASERALDSDTLLVFEDREVMGYIYETFGPTMQPFYQVKFSDSFPLDPIRVRIGREVFHVPAQSKFVFVSQIKAMKGSDASNVHDEEPGDDELEFSDDEAEAAHRNRFKRKRADSRGGSTASSRAATPNPAMMYDQELAVADDAFFSGNAYDERGPYDIDYTLLPAIPSSSSSRLTLPYDDPYADPYVAPDVVEGHSEPTEPTFPRDRSFDRDRPLRGRGRGNRTRSYGDRERGRGAGRGGQRHPRQRQGARPSPKTFLPSTHTAGQVGYPGHQQQQEYSPLYPGQQMPGPIPMHYPYSASIGYQHQSQHTESLGLPGIQPHINPRFASAFGFSVHPAFAGHGRDLPSQEQAYASSNWTDEWTIPTQDPGGFGPNTEGSGL